ncbi:MAG: hypothetical protein ACKPKO_28575, partial [Candidatus Fonsibacter sp.]
CLILPRRLFRILPLTRRSPKVSALAPATREMGSDRREKGQRYPTDEVEIATVIKVGTRGNLAFRFVVHAANSKANAAKSSHMLDND